MTPSLLLAFSLLPLAFWLGLSLDRSRAWPRGCYLPSGRSEAEASGRQTPGRRVTAVVPARDEAKVLPQTLGALLEQEVPGRFRVLLVDDGSTDGTAEVARRVAAEAGREERLEVLPAGPRPAGWTGKVHALSVGVEKASGLARACEDPGGGAGPPEWLLFTDADIRHRPGSVAALLAEARRGPYDLVSVMARLRAETFWERLLIPAFVFYFQLLYPFRKVKDPRSPVAAAAGGCILVRRQILEAAGGVAAIRRAVIDDVSLARRVAAAGGRLWLGLDAGILSVRPYRGLGELWGMVSRSAFVQLRHSWILLALVLLGLAVLVASPPWLALLAAGSLQAGGGPFSLMALAASLVAWVLQARALAPAVAHHRVPRRWAWALPFASVLYGLMTWTSGWDHLRGRGSRWKGRSYGGSRVGPRR